MPLFGGNTEPGSDAFRACPECGKDEIFSQSDGILSGTEYLCNHCGYEAEKHEVKKSFNELYKENKEKNDKKISEKLEKIGGEEENPFSEIVVKSRGKRQGEISDPELKQQVEDRQAEGWEIEEITDSGERVVMCTTKGGTIGGHALTGVLTGGWTFGMGNVAYSKLSKKKNKERIVLRTDGESNSPTQKRDTENPIELIRELKKINEEGLISDTEFEEKKQKLLDKI